ncbi:hypothetical protein [Bacillus sp. 166amftsu]|uniref:hypothetical protein n=1 Tax=Bacillus sp. 166amftsu TaxID=1761753 RepID=UPI001B8CF611|nr:hypothetical protein [Bacillus sp. 166amftsu]
MTIFPPYLIAFPARFAAFPIGTKFKSVQPAAMSLSFLDNSFSVTEALTFTWKNAVT